MRVTEKEAIAMFNKAGMITRYKGYYIIAFEKESDKVWRSVGKVRCANGTVAVNAVNELI